jgi:uncharacterized protein involved in exopolysaccharide biosynthesis
MNDLSPDRSLSRSDDDIRRLASLLRRHARLIIGCAVLGGALSGANALLTKATYTAHAELLLSPRPVSPLQASDNLVTFDAPFVDSQIAILNSGDLAHSVINELGLSDDAEFWRPNDGTGALLLKDLHKRLAVTRDGMSYAINISFTSQDAVKAAKIANAFARGFIRGQIEERAQQAKQRQEWLENRIVTIRQQLNDASRAVQTFKSRGDFTISAPENNRETLEELEAKASTYRKLIESYLYAQAESSQEQSLALANARVITPALPPTESNTKMKWLVLLGGLAGAVFGVGLALAGNAAQFDHLLSRLRSARVAAMRYVIAILLFCILLALSYPASSAIVGWADA